jgi:2-oxoisovalerate dehydrogenase E1 component
LKNEGVLDDAFIQKETAAIKKQINTGLDVAYAAPEIEADAKREYDLLFADFDNKPIVPSSERKTEKRLIDAISDGLRQSMEKHDKLIIMGQDIAEYGGVFKVTEGFSEQFGKERVRNTPICESAIVGAALGLSIKGYKAVMEMQFSDFVTVGFNQIVNNLAKLHYRWQENADVVIRMPLRPLRSN